MVYHPVFSIVYIIMIMENGNVSGSHPMCYCMGLCYGAM